MLHDALPVAAAFADPDLHAEVTAYVESRLGWQVISHGPHLPARLCLSDQVHPDLPTVAITRGQVDPRPLLRSGALDVLAWPEEADRLPDLVPPATRTAPADRIVLVGGVGPRVGTTTVALSIGAVIAWQGRRTTVLTDAEGCRLAGVDTHGQVEGVAGLWVRRQVGVSKAWQRPDVIVVDRGATTSAHLIVGVPDRVFIVASAALPPTCGLVLRGDGGLHRAELDRLVGGRRVARLPESFRVARAGLRGRVPVGIPGTHLRELRSVLGSLVHGRTRQVAA